MVVIWRTVEDWETKMESGCGVKLLFAAVL